MEILREERKFGELKLAEIVRLLSLCQNNERDELLISTFYDMIKVDFYDRCFKSTWKLFSGNPEIKFIAEEIFHDALILILVDINTFTVGQKCEDSEYRKRILGWMGKFAIFLLLNKQNKDEKEKRRFEKFKKYSIADSIPGSVGKRHYEPTYDKQKLDSVWKGLNPMARELVLYCAENDMFDPDGPKHLPPEKRQDLCERYGVKENSLNQAKRRALLAIASCKIEL